MMDAYMRTFYKNQQDEEYISRYLYSSEYAFRLDSLSAQQLADITEQYMEYVRKMQEENLDIVSEFLVMAATLLDIKCRMLLPKEVDEEGNEEDPRAELVEQLLEYKLFKAMAEELKGQQLDALKTYYRKPDIPEEVSGYTPPDDLNEVVSPMSISYLMGMLANGADGQTREEILKTIGYGCNNRTCIFVEESS